MRTAPIRVLCVDDHRIVREGIALIIGRQPDMKVVGSAATGEEAIELFQRHHPNVTLMDLQLGRMSGVEAIRAIRRTRQERADCRADDVSGGRGHLPGRGGRRGDLPAEGHAGRRSHPRRSRGACRRAPGESQRPGSALRTGGPADADARGKFRSSSSSRRACGTRR